MDEAPSFISRGDGCLRLRGEGVTAEDVKKALGHPRHAFLTHQGWRLVVINEVPVVVAPVKRVSSDSLEIFREVFHYQVAAGTICLFRYVPTMRGIKKIPANNANLKAVAKHFLEHEHLLGAS